MTSGGIGPTHDDRTYEAVAAATGGQLAVHAPTVERMTAHYHAQGKEVNAARMRMATLPQSPNTQVYYQDGIWVPVVCSNNVYVLPGIPSLFARLVDSQLHRFRGAGEWQLVNLFTTAGEGDFAEELAILADQHSEVTIGSYPADITAGACHALGCAPHRFVR